ncbi:MAG: hypothetical protein PHS37_09360, partial [Candidatus Omnitrophica bacterium]|nr:hypothetical protein [Candidatus Omnitrophota bacterium]
PAVLIKYHGKGSPAEDITVSPEGLISGREVDYSSAPFGGALLGDILSELIRSYELFVDPIILPDGTRLRVKTPLFWGEFLDKNFEGEKLGYIVFLVNDDLSQRGFINDFVTMDDLTLASSITRTLLTKGIMHSFLTLGNVTVDSVSDLAVVHDLGYGVNHIRHDNLTPQQVLAWNIIILNKLSFLLEAILAGRTPYAFPASAGDDIDRMLGLSDCSPDARQQLRSLQDELIERGVAVTDPGMRKKYPILAYLDRQIRQGRSRFVRHVDEVSPVSPALFVDTRDGKQTVRELEDATEHKILNTTLDSIIKNFDMRASAEFNENGVRRLIQEEVKALTGREDVKIQDSRAPPIAIYIIDDAKLKAALPDDYKYLADGLITHAGTWRTDPKGEPHANLFIPKSIYDVLRSLPETSRDLILWRQHEIGHLADRTADIRPSPEEAAAAGGVWNSAAKSRLFPTSIEPGQMSYAPNTSTVEFYFGVKGEKDEQGLTGIYDVRTDHYLNVAYHGDIRTIARIIPKGKLRDALIEIGLHAGDKGVLEEIARLLGEMPEAYFSVDDKLALMYEILENSPVNPSRILFPEMANIKDYTQRYALELRKYQKETGLRYIKAGIFGVGDGSVFYYQRMYTLALGLNVNYVCVDIAADKIAQAKNKFIESPDICFIVQDLSKINVADRQWGGVGSYDYIDGICFMHEIYSSAGVARSTGRVHFDEKKAIGAVENMIWNISLMLRQGGCLVLLDGYLPEPEDDFEVLVKFSQSAREAFEYVLQNYIKPFSQGRLVDRYQTEDENLFRVSAGDLIDFAGLLRYFVESDYFLSHAQGYDPEMIMFEVFRYTTIRDLQRRLHAAGLEVRRYDYYTSGLRQALFDEHITFDSWERVPRQRFRVAAVKSDKGGGIIQSVDHPPVNCSRQPIPERQKPFYFSNPALFVDTRAGGGVATITGGKARLPMTYSYITGTANRMLARLTAANKDIPWTPTMSEPCTIGMVIKAEPGKGVDAILKEHLAKEWEIIGRKLSNKIGIERGIKIGTITYLVCVDDGTDECLKEFKKRLKKAGNPKERTFAWIMSNDARKKEDNGVMRELNSVANLVGLQGEFLPISWQMVAGPLFVNLLNQAGKSEADKDQAKIDSIAEAIVKSIAEMERKPERADLKAELERASVTDLARKFNGISLIIDLPPLEPVSGVLEQCQHADKEFQTSL